FFQAEDGIRDFHVTGVQTCALPISYEETVNFIVAECDKAIEMTNDETTRGVVNKSAARALKSRVLLYAASDLYNKPGNSNDLVRSEERRVGQGCRWRWAWRVVRNNE